VVMSPAGLEPENDCAGETQQQRGCYIRAITASVQLENKNFCRGTQGACRQDEMIGGKPTVVK
jgi:hypothetical protein